MLKRLRIAGLLYVLLFVAAAQFLAARRATDWDSPLWVDVYAVAGDDRQTTRRFIAELRDADFDGVETFFAREAQRYGVELSQPFRLRAAGAHEAPLPSLTGRAGAVEILWWSLRMRWLAARLRWQRDGPSGDIVVFAVFHEPAASMALDRSTALEEGLIAVANLFADRTARATNDVVLAHELLHTLGATDKYSPETNAPLFPDGYAAPAARPLLPQAKAELMAGRIPLDETRAQMPASLRDVVIGASTAREIGWNASPTP